MIKLILNTLIYASISTAACYLISNGNGFADFLVGFFLFTSVFSGILLDIIAVRISK